MARSYSKLDEDNDAGAGKIINAVIALIMEAPCFILLTIPNGYWIVGVIFLWFWFAASVGDALRRYTRPKAFWSESSVTSIFFTRLYWKIGPQIKAVGLAYLVLIAAVIYMVDNADNGKTPAEAINNEQITEKQSEDTQSGIIRSINPETVEIQYRD